MKLTQWFPGDVKPVHVGVYQRRLKSKTNVYYSRWDGENWLYMCGTVDKAARQVIDSVYQNLPWRGGAEMSNQPDALRLADALDECKYVDVYRCKQAAAELRRLHQFAEDQIGRATAAEAALQMTKATHSLKIAAVEAQRDALLELLDRAADTLHECGLRDEIYAAIKAVEGEST